MTWARLDDNFPNHPKVLAAGPYAEIVQVRAICYCCQYLTDGWVPASVLPALFRGLDHSLDRSMTDAIALVIGLLCAHGLWKPARRARETGYKIHDFLDYNQKRADVEKARDDKSRAGKRGASVRWAKDSSAENGSRHRDSRHHGNRQASANGREMPPSRPASTTPPSPSSGFTAAMLNDCDDGQAGFCVRTEFLATVPPDLRRQCPAHTTPPEEVKPAW